ncbi:MAG: hypothetical protein H7Y31_03165 [Chitinophagaceae bacterium]|nr:hypothetical protein [Chitinophagaceae bacterium]
MKSIGSILFILGAVASILGLIGRDSIILRWMNDLGETVSWIIKIGLMVLGATLYIIGGKKESADNNGAES